MNQTLNGLFSVGLDAAASQWLKRVHSRNDDEIRAAIALEMLRVAEALVISPRVTFKIYGENVVLSILVKFFGEKRVRELLEGRSIDFVLWTPEVTYTSDRKILAQGIWPIQSGIHTSAPHSDPLVSALTGLEGWCPEVTSANRTELAKLAARNTFLPPEDLSHKAVSRIVQAYTAGVLDDQGFSSTVEINEIEIPQIRRLAKLAENAVEACIILDRDLDVLQSEESWESLWYMIATLKAKGGIRDAAREILNLERLPSIPALILDRSITWDDVITIRGRKETQHFRRWLWSQPNPNDVKGVSEEYLRVITYKKDLTDKAWFKAAKISTVSVIGALIGSVVADTIGSITGTLVGSGIGTGISLADGLLVDRLLNRPSPRRFATDVISTHIIKNRMNREGLV